MRCAALIGAGLLAAACGPADKSGACKDTIGPGDLVITEVFADFKAPAGSSGADTGKEWFEIYNASDRPIELKGLTLTHSRQDGSKANTHTMTNVTVAPGQYFTLGDSTQDLVAPYVDYGYGADLGDFYNTDGGKLALSCGDTEIDSAGYDTVKEGHARELTAALPPDYTVNDDLASWCQADDTEFETGNFGTPGADNDCVPVVVGQCNDAGTMRATLPPGVGDLVITELMPKPHAVSATVGQWFEVRATKDVDLNGIGLDRANDNNVAPQEVASGDCIHLATGDYAVFARSGDMAMNGGIAAAGTFSFSLNPSANPDVQIVYGGTIIDAVTWTTSTTGKSLNLDPDFVDSASNDDPGNFCDGATIYNTVGANSDLGTPRADNTECVAQPGPGECLDGGAPRAIVKPTAGQLVISEFMANPAGTSTDTTMEWFEIVNTSAAAFDLNDLTVKGKTTMNDVHSVDCKSVAAGAYALFAHSIDPLTNGGLPDVDATFTTSLLQSNGVLSILDGATVIDAITWTTGIVDGASKQLQPAMLDAVANDTPANFCNAAAAQTYGTAANLGTPKAVNVCM